MHFYECKALNKDGDIIGKKIFADENSDFFEIFKKSELILEILFQYYEIYVILVDSYF